MGADSKIQWTHHTFNPYRGCTKVSEGCANCYAEKQSKRNSAVLGVWGDNGTRVVASESMWREPLKWNKAAEKAGERRRVFCASLADVFEDRPDLVEPRARLFALIDQTPWLDWLLLTKRPETWRKVMRDTIDAMPKRGTVGPFTGSRWNMVDWLQGGDPSGRAFPPNVWMGVSAENQKRANERIPFLLSIPAAVRFVSAEPLLGPIDFRPYIAPPCSECGHSLEGRRLDGTCAYVANVPPYGNRCHRDGVNWIIVGGESGPNARPCDVQWIRSIVAQCQAAGTAVFVKQLGANLVFGEPLHGFTAPHAGRTKEGWQMLIDPKGGDPSEWPEDLRVREFPR